MTTLPHAQHTIRRKAYAPHYTPSNIGLFQPELRDIVSGLVGVGVSLSNLSGLPFAVPNGTSFPFLTRNRTHGVFPSYPSHASSTSLLTPFDNQTLNSLPSHTAVETLSLLRHLFVDVIVQSEFGYRLGSVEQ